MGTPFKSRRWKPLRARIIARDGVCMIRGEGCTGAAEDVDHIRSWRLGKQYWFDETNLRAACRKCNRGRRTELVILTAGDLPTNIGATADEMVVADIASGKTWLLNVNTRTIRTAEEARPDGTTRGKGADEW